MLTLYRILVWVIFHRDECAIQRSIASALLPLFKVPLGAANERDHDIIDYLLPSTWEVLQYGNWFSLGFSR